MDLKERLFKNFKLRVLIENLNLLKTKIGNNTVKITTALIQKHKSCDWISHELIFNRDLAPFADLNSTHGEK